MVFIHRYKGYYLCNYDFGFALRQAYFSHGSRAAWLRKNQKRQILFIHAYRRIFDFAERGCAFILPAFKNSAARRNGNLDFNSYKPVLADAAGIIHHPAPKKKIAVGAYFIKTLLGFTSFPPCPQAAYLQKNTSCKSHSFLWRLTQAGGYFISIIKIMQQDLILSADNLFMLPFAFCKANDEENASYNPIGKHCKPNAEQAEIKPPIACQNIA